MKKLNIKAIAAAITLSASLSANAGSVGGMGGSTEITQLMNNSELMAVVSEQAATYGVQLEEYIRAYQEMQRNAAMMQNAGAQLQAYGNQAQLLSLAKVALVDLAKSAAKSHRLMGADLKTMRKFEMTPAEYYTNVADGAAANNQAARDHLDQVVAAQADLQQKSQAVKELHIETISCDGNVKCLQGLATQNAQLSEVMIEMSGDIKQLLALQLKRETERRDQLSAEAGREYSEARRAEREGLKRALSYPAKSYPAK